MNAGFRRQAFSLTELVICAAIVATLAAAALLFLGNESQDALVSRARNELDRMAREVQGRALTAPNYHFDSLSQALGLDSPPLDPWGNPYVLMHGQSGYQYRPELTYWRDGSTDALFAEGVEGEVGEVLLAHRIVSSGPNQAFFRHRAEGSYDPEEDDLQVSLKLGKPRMPVPSPSESADGQLGSVTALTETIVINPFDFGVPDGDKVRFLLNGEIVRDDFLLVPLPGGQIEIKLQPGSNILAVTALNEGSEPPNTASMNFSNTSRGSSDTVHWALTKGRTGTVLIRAPTP